MIRVLHVVTIMNRNGLENRIMDIYRNIDRNRIQFDFLVQREEKGMFDDEIVSLGGKIYYSKKLSPFKFFSYLKFLDSFFQIHDEYRIVHSHVNAFSTWVLLMAKKNNIPVRIAHSRTWGIEKSWKAIFKYASKLFINQTTTHKFACSRQAGEWLFGKKGVLPPNKFKVIPNSIMINKFSYNLEVRKLIREELNIKDDFYAYVNVGRFVPQKNHSFILEIFREIVNIEEKSLLFLFGEGEFKNKIIKDIDRLNLTKNVFLLGNSPDIGAYLNAMDAFIFPSLFEGFGTVVIEAQCSGLPVLASNKIPYETKITDLQEFMSLKCTSKEWANKIIDMVHKNNRTDHSKEVKMAGYDVEDTYIDLENFYLKVVNNNYDSEN